MSWGGGSSEIKCWGVGGLEKTSGPPPIVILNGTALIEHGGTCSFQKLLFDANNDGGYAFGILERLILIYKCFPNICVYLQEADIMI